MHEPLMNKKKARAHKPQAQSAQAVSNWHILAIDATNDAVSSAVHEYRQRVLYPRLKQEAAEVVLLAGANDTRTNVAKEAVSSTVRYIMAEGHGTQDALEGYSHELVFAKGKYAAKEVGRKIAHFLSCKTAVSLGPDMVSRGCSAFFGYDIDYSFPCDFSEIFLECDSEIDVSFATGHSAKEVYSRTREIHRQRIAELRHQGGDAPNRAAAFLEVLLLHLRCPSAGGSEWGRETARIW
jgi:hypothetical protein